MSPLERIAAIETSLLRAHCLSKAIGFILTNDDAGEGGRGSTFRAAIEEVNDCTHEAIQAAIDLVEELEAELKKGGAI